MLQPFLYNHHLNVIREQIDVLLYNVSHLVDADVKAAVQHTIADKLLALFPTLSKEQHAFIDEIRYLDVSEIEHFLERAQKVVIPFPELAQNEIEKLFRKSKKVKLPYSYPRTITYLGWNDIQSKRKYLIYPYKGDLLGVEGSYTILNQRTTCYLCGRYGEVAHVSSRVYDHEDYHTVGHYMCVDSVLCNEYLKDTAPLEAFFEKVHNEALNA